MTFNSYFNSVFNGSNDNPFLLDSNGMPERFLCDISVCEEDVSGWVGCF